MKIIDEIQIVPIKPKFGHIAFASFVLFDSIYLSSVAIYTRPYGGIRLVYPRTKNVDLCHPIRQDIGDEIERAVLDEMQKYELV